MSISRDGPSSCSISSLTEPRPNPVTVESNSPDMPEDQIAAALDANNEIEEVERTRVRTLGNVRLRHHDTNEIILVPTPSSDPQDPLNWYISLLLLCPTHIANQQQVTTVQVLHGKW